MCYPYFQVRARPHVRLTVNVAKAMEVLRREGSATHTHILYNTQVTCYPYMSHIIYLHEHKC